MFDKKKDFSNNLSSDLTSVFRPAKGASKVIVGEGVVLKGEITNASEVQIDGEVDIVIKSDNISVGSTGSLKGTIEAENADIWGKANGDLKISNTLTIQELGSVTGKIEYAKLQIKLGGEISGDITKKEHTKNNKVLSKDQEESKKDDTNSLQDSLK
jgi:cytoskeletal protein CcmA (bactofilin family)